MRVFMFPGQGSQSTGMGRDLFDEVQEYKAVERDADSRLGYSMRALCLENPNNQLARTEFTQPAMYTVNALHYYAKLREGVRPDLAIGHSLGEYNALLAAGAFDFLTGLAMVRKRGALMAQATGGGMAAVIGLNPERIAEALGKGGLGSIDVANYNSARQTVISGPTEDIRRAGPVLQDAGARAYVPLPVSAAFHSRYMVKAAAEFERFLIPFQFYRLRIPVISNVTGEAYPMEGSPRLLKKFLVRQIAEPVRWSASLAAIRRLGAAEYQEIGNGNVLSKLLTENQEPGAARQQGQPDVPARQFAAGG